MVDGKRVGAVPGGVLPAGATYEDIRVMYFTGKFIRNFGSQDKRAGEYRSGVMTKLGDIEEMEWIRFAEELIRRNNDEQLFEQLKSWYKKTTPWLRTEKELHRYSLECFVARIYENPAWVDYEAFGRAQQVTPEISRNEVVVCNAPNV